MTRARPMLALTLATAVGLAVLSACAPGTEVTSSPSPTPASAVPAALFLGDSYTAGTALSDSDIDQRWSTRVSEQMGWREIQAGCNGSGYTRPGLRCGTDYVERIPELANTEPDIVFVSGGVNDLGATADEITAAVTQTLTDLRASFPDARIYAVGGIYYTGQERPAQLQELNHAVASAAASVGAEYADIGEPLLGRPDLMAPDGLHPNPEGHALIADLTMEAFGLEP